MSQEDSGAKSVEDSKTPKPELVDVSKPRLLVIETDGTKVTIQTCQLTDLEICEVARRLIRLVGGTLPE